MALLTDVGVFPYNRSVYQHTELLYTSHYVTILLPPLVCVLKYNCVGTQLKTMALQYFHNNVYICMLFIKLYLHNINTLVIHNYTLYLHSK